MSKVNVHEAKTELSRLLEEVEGGERIIIAQRRLRARGRVQVSAHQRR